MAGSKTPQTADPYVAFAFVTADEIVAHYGITGGVAALPTEEQQRYTDYATSANRQTETAIYRYIDSLPLDTKDEANTYAKGMAFYYALWLKQADDGANNTAQMKEIWEEQKKLLIETIKAQPKDSTTRTMVSNGYEDFPIPYSQSYGLSDIL